MEKQLVIFELEKEYFGIDISDVEGIIKMQTITPVPQSPEFVEGVTNLRGSILPVIDLKKRFGIGIAEKTIETRIVVIMMGGLKIGMIVDAVSEVLTIEDNIIEPTPPMISTVGTEFIIGIAKIDERLVILLDLARILTTQEKLQAELLLPA